MAGFRVGYGFAHEDLIENLNKVKLPFEPSWPAQVAAVAALDDEDYIQKTISNCHHWKEKLEQTFQKAEIKTIPSAANFITLVFENEEEAKSFNDNILHKGNILSHLKGWGLPDCIRVTVGTKEDNMYFLKQLATILQTA